MTTPNLPGYKAPPKAHQTEARAERDRRKACHDNWHPCDVAHPNKSWTTEELRDEFIVKGFALGFVVVERKADGVVGSMTFDGNPRVYSNWQEDKP